MPVAIGREFEPEPTSVGFIDVVQKYGRFAQNATLTAVAASLISISKIPEVVPALSWIRPVCLMSIIAVAVSGVFLCIVTGEFVAAIATVLMICSVPFYAWTFSELANVSFSIASAGDWYTFGLFGITYLAMKRGNKNWLFQKLYKLSIAYAIVYILLCIGYRLGLVAISMDSGGVIGSDAASGRDTRIILATSYICYGLFVSLASIRRSLTPVGFVWAGVFVTCLILSQSRTITFMCLAVFITYLTIGMSYIIQRVTFVLFTCGALISIYIAFTPSLNPFSPDKYNLSEWARHQEISISQALIPQNLTGIGIAYGEDGYMPITHVNYYNWNDIGMIGVITAFGMLGVLLYYIQATAACFSPRRLSGAVDPHFIIGISLSGAVMVMYSLLAPVFAGGSGSFWGVMFLALMFIPKTRNLAYPRNTLAKIEDK